MTRAGRGGRVENVQAESREGRGSFANKRGKHSSTRRTAHVSLLTTLIVCSALIVTAFRRHYRSPNRFPRPELGRGSFFSFPSKLASAANVGQSTPPESGTSSSRPPHKPIRKLDRSGVQESFTTIRQDWRIVLNNFLDDADPDMFSARKIREHFYSDFNNVQSSCMLVTIKNGNVTFNEKYRENSHSRASSVKYILRRIVKEKGPTLAGATFMVMVSDGHRPLVPTFGSARHWKDWKMLTPVPLGNSRGTNVEWGTPLEGWNSYIDNTIVNTHVNYSWNKKYEKALFRGSLSMQTYKLGSCNEENGGRCARAAKWSEVNRGVLYERTKEAPDLFDVVFTQHKPKADGPSNQFEGAPRPQESMKFHDFQKFKYVLNVGNNQGKYF